jgi:type VI secretion system VasD/TssJ family lipoprotein
MITRDEYTLVPKDSRTIEVALSGEARFVGAAAGYRDLLNAQWRVIVPTPRKGLTIAVERTRLVLSAAE